MQPSEEAALLLIQRWRDQAPLLVSEYHHAFRESSRVLRDLEAYCGIFSPGPANDSALQRMEGRREVFLWIRTILSLSAAEVETIINYTKAQHDD